MKISPPLRLTFSTAHDNDNEKRLTFDVLEKDLDKHTRFFVVVPEKAGCVTISLDPSPGSDDRTAVIQSVKHDTTCAREGLPRKYGTRAMILGALNVLKNVAITRYPHLDTFELNDEAAYPCLPFTGEGEGKIKTFATDLLLRRETYYERHLNARPCKNTTTTIVESVKRRVSDSIDTAFSDFWKVLIGPVSRDIERKPKKVEWLHERKAAIQDIFQKNKHQSWQAFFQAIYKTYNCAFFACCWWRLCIFFDMTRLVGAAWYVPFSELPSRDISYSKKGGGGRGRQGKNVSKKADREICSLIKNKLRGNH